MSASRKRAIDATRSADISPPNAIPGQSAERKSFAVRVGRRPIAEIAAPELLATVRKIESRGAHDLSHRVLQVCGQVFRYGIATARCAVDPTRDLRGALTPNVTKHQPAVRPEEMPELVRAIATYDTLGDRQTRLALQLLMHTFVRTNELIGAEWTEFDLGAAL